jgi:hypothetical protein
VTRLEALLARAEPGQVAVLDWDNTVQARNIGEATFGALQVAGKLTIDAVRAALSPDFTVDGRPVSLAEDGLDGYYQAIAHATLHQEDTAAHITQAAWLAQIHAGLTPLDIVNAATRAYADGQGEFDAVRPDRGIDTIGSYPRPFLRSAMVELVAALVAREIRVFVVSASTPWAVRTMVAELNRRVAEMAGEEPGAGPPAIPPDRVVGLAPLLRDRRTGELVRDRLLVRSTTPAGRAYAAQEPDALERFELTPLLDHPITDFAGKVANVIEHVTPRRPWLVAGDSPGDFANLERAENRLWLARLDGPPATHARVATLIDRSHGEGWIVQPALAGARPAFVATRTDLNARLAGADPHEAEIVEEAVATLGPTGALEGF